MTEADTVQNEAPNDQTTAPAVTAIANPNRDPTDPDHAELLEIEQAEQGAAAPTEATEGTTGPAATESQEGAQQPPAEGAAPAGAAQPQDQPAPAPKGETPMIPKGRFDEVLEQNRQLRETNSRMLGRLEAADILTKRIGVQPAGDAQPAAAPAPTPEQRMAAIEDGRNALAEKFDAGEMTMVEYQREDGALEREMFGIREEQILAKVPAPTTAAPAAQPVSDLYREERLDALEAEHPYATRIPDDHPGWDVLNHEATRQLTAEGKNLDPNNPAHDLIFRKKVAELTDVYGPLWTGLTPEQVGLKKSAAAPANGNGQPTTPAPQQPAKPSAMAQARAAKLDLASQMPPDVGQMGGRTDSNEMWDDNRVVSLSEEEYEALPAPNKAAIARRHPDHASP